VNILPKTQRGDIQCQSTLPLLGQWIIPYTNVGIISPYQYQLTLGKSSAIQIQGGVKS